MVALNVHSVKMPTLCHLIAAFVLVLSIAIGFQSCVKMFLGDGFCKVTCLEQALNYLRVDPWDLKLLKSGLCLPKRCYSKFDLRMRERSDLNLLDYCKETELNTTECFEIKTDLEYLKETLVWKTDLDLYSFQYCLKDHFREIDDDPRECNQLYGKNINLHEQRRVGFAYYDFLNFRRFFTDESRDLEVRIRITGGDSLSQQELSNICSLLLIQFNHNCRHGQGLSIHTHVLDQSVVIFSDDSKQLAHFSILLSLIFILLAFYVLNNVAYSLHGNTEQFYSYKYNVENQRKARLFLYRPDLINVKISKENLFSFWGWDSLIHARYCIKSKCFAYVKFNTLFISYLSILLIDRIQMFVLEYIFLFFMHFLLFRNLILTLSLIVTTELIFGSMLASVRVWMFNLYRFYILCIPTLLYVCIAKLSFQEQNILLQMLRCKRTYEVFLFQTWPVQYVVNLSEGYLWPPWPFIFKRQLISKQYFSLSDNKLNCLWLLIFSILCYIGFTLEQPTVSYYSTIYLRDFIGDYEPYDYPLNRYNAKYLILLCYWLYFPFCFFFITFVRSYMKWMYEKISLWIVSFCMAMTCILLSNFLLPWLYLFLKTLPTDSFLIWLPVSATFVIYVLEVWRTRFAHYDDYLQSILSYIQKDEQALDNSDDNSIAITYKLNHLTCKPFIYRHNGDHTFSDGKYHVQGFIIFISSGNTYISQDLFYELIQLPGGPGSFKSVIKSELFSLFLRFFPALFIFWLCQIIHLTDMSSYEPVLKAVISVTFMTLYKGLFLHRHLPKIDVSSNIAMKREVNKLLIKFRAWAFSNKDDLNTSEC